MRLYLCAPPLNWFIDAYETLLSFSERGGGGYVFKEEKDKQQMNMYLAGAQGWGKYCHEKRNMDLYIAGTNGGQGKNVKDAGMMAQKIFVLESFFYIADWMLPFIKNEWRFLLDSGAFTFMQNTKAKLNWDEYVTRYANFINEHKIELFFELDIDSIVGIKEVERLRNKLETLTGKKCIPVWHKSRGKEYWIRMCKDYDYVAIGGIVSGEIKRKEYPFFTPLLNMAKERGAEVHGLGFTNLEGLTNYPFYSVDSTAWIYGNRGGLSLQVQRKVN